MSARDIIFLDTETTSLRRPWMRAPKRVWDVGMVVWPGGDESKRSETQFFIHLSDEALADADPFALSVGKFYARYDFTLNRWYEVSGTGCKVDEEVASHYLTEKVAGARLVGNFVTFDEEALADMAYRHGQRFDVYYHSLDLYSMSVGYLQADAEVVPTKTEDICEALAVEMPSDEDRHTALGDARWNERWYKALQARY